MPRCLSSRCLRFAIFVCCAGLVAVMAAGWARAEEPDPPAAADPDSAAIRQLLEIAWSEDRQAPQVAQQMYKSLRGQMQNRSRWDYAYGVAALNMKRYPAALQAFSAATRDAAAFDFAAWKGLLWTEFRLKKYADGLEHVEALAKIAAADDFTGDAAERERIAVWIGQALAALDKIVKTPKIQERLAETNARLHDMWPPELEDAYRSGREYTDIQYDDLMSDIQGAANKAKSRAEEARSEKLNDLQKKIGDADKTRESLKKSAEELQQQAERKLLQIDKQLARLERDYDYLQTRAMSVMRSIALIQTQLQQAQANQGNRNNQTGPFGGTVRPSVAGLDFMLGAYQREFEATTFRAAAISNQAMQGLETRQQFARQAQSTLGALSGRNAELEKWQSRQKKAGENLKKSKIKATSPTVHQKRAKAKSLDTYLEFDLDWERIRLTEPPDPT